MIKNKLDFLKEKFLKILKMDAPPNAIATGAAVGIFWNFIPSLGVGPFLSLFLAKLLKGSAVSAVTINLATGFFIPVFYTMNVAVGRSIMGNSATKQEIEYEIGQSFQQSVRGIESVMEHPTDYLLLDRIQSLSTDFLTGSIVNSLIAAALVYSLIWLIIHIKKNREKTKTIA